MSRIGMILAGMSVTAALTCGQAFATPIDPNGTFGFIGIGTITVDTGDITAATASKTLPGVELVNTIPGTFLGNPNNLGLTLASTVTLSYLVLTIPHPLNTLTPLATVLDITVPTTGGLLTFRFTDAITLSLNATTGSGTGGFVVGYEGTLIADTSGTFNLGSPTSLSESCSQSQAGSTINCSETIATPTNPFKTPEPGTLLLVGCGLLGVAIAGRGLRVGRS